MPRGQRSTAHFPREVVTWASNFRADLLEMDVFSAILAEINGPGPPRAEPTVGPGGFPGKQAAFHAPLTQLGQTRKGQCYRD